MLSFEAAGRVLDEAVDALPEGIYQDLNGGVNLVRQPRRAEDGRYTMGLYHNDSMGRYVEIFYGSFAAVYGGEPDERVAEELVRTLHHELTHHVESKAGDRTLERWDEEQTELWRQQGEALEAESVLFLDAGGELAAEAERLFRAELPDMPCASASLAGADGALLARYDAALCMTLEEADGLAERFPEYDRRILCLGERDILPPLTARTRRQLRREVRALARELGAP